MIEDLKICGISDTETLNFILMQILELKSDVNS